MISKRNSIKDILASWADHDIGKAEYRPYIDWRRLVMAFTFIFAVIAGLHYYFYATYSLKEAAYIPPAAITIDRVALIKAMEKIAIKEHAFETLIIDQRLTADPAR